MNINSCGLLSCLASVQSWMSTIKLKLNPDKTEVLLIGNERRSMFPIGLLGVKTNPDKSARNLGAIFDKNFTFRSHISVVCNSCFYHMWDLRRIRRHLDLDREKNCLLLLSCPVVLIIGIHFCMVLLTLTSLGFKHVQNQLAPLVTNSPLFTCSIPLLRSLYWLPVRFRIQ